MAFQRLLLVCLVVMMTAPAGAQSYRSRRSAGLTGGDDYHFGYISGTVGYSMMQTSIYGAMPQGNLGGAVGLGYEFRNSGLWVNAGLQLSFHRSKLIIDEYSTKIEPDQTPYRGVDTEGDPATFHYRVNQVDEINWNYIDVPLMVGYYTHGFHVGGGLKISYAINPKTHVTGKYNLSTTNDGLGVTFENLPDRWYKDYPYERTIENRLNVGVSLIGELGYDLLSSMPTSSRVCNVLKLSVYVEYGLNNQLRGWETPDKRVVPNPKDMREATINPYINTFGSPARTVPFYTGVKLTYMIGGSRTARSGFHHGCMCYN